MAKEDVKPEIDQALTDLGYDLLEQNSFDQDEADAARRDAEEASLIRWEVGSNEALSYEGPGRSCKFRLLVLPATAHGIWRVAGAVRGACELATAEVDFNGRNLAQGAAGRPVFGRS